MRTVFLASAVAAALLAAGCADKGEAPSAQRLAPEPSAQRLAALTSKGIHVDYDPLTSPRDAVAKGDLIVRGTLADVVDGIVVKHPDPLYTERAAGAYATFVLSVDEVLSGDASKLVDRRLYVTVSKARNTQVAELARANSHPGVVAVLDDISDWTPTRAATVARPAAAPAGSPLYFPYTDGLWLQDEGAPAMTGLQVEPRELSPEWGAPRTVNEVAASIRAIQP